MVFNGTLYYVDINYAFMYVKTANGFFLFCISKVTLEDNLLIIKLDVNLF